VLIVALGWAPTQKPAAPAPTPAAAPEFKDLAALMAALPPATVKPIDASSALLFTALPLTCVDDLQPRPAAARPYFWQPTYRTVDAFDHTRAFYGCNDWPTAVGATWTLVTILKKYPDIGSSQIVREKLTAHLGRDNLDGELAYFRGAGNAQRPYGYAWFLRLYAELATWKDPDGTRYAENAAPLARYFVDGVVSYLVDLERPNRSGSQANTALSLDLLLDYVDATRDMTIKRAASDAAKRLYASDTTCETKTEAAAPEMVSPCLEEASVMSRVLDSATFAAWFDKFLPAAQSAEFTPLRSIAYDATGRRGGGRGAGGRGAAGRGAGDAAAQTGQAAQQSAPPTPPATPSVRPPVAGAAGAEPPANAAGAPASDTAGPGAPGGGRGPQTNPRASWIALAFTRAAAYTNLAAALPAGDPRIAVFKRLADIHAEGGERELVTPAAYDAPWVGALALSYLQSLGGHQ
jgi:hypothetical protein